MNKKVGQRVNTGFPNCLWVRLGRVSVQPWCEQHVPLVALAVSGRVAPAPAPVPPVGGGRASPPLVSVAIPTKEKDRSGAFS